MADPAAKISGRSTGTTPVGETSQPVAMAAMTAHRHGWMPVATEAAVQAAAPGPLAVRLFGEDLVLWQPPGGAAVAFADRCPHRGARLSLGLVSGLHLQCAYHGWRFDATGRCHSVPSLPNFTPPPGHAAESFAVCAAHGLLWLSMASGQGSTVVPAADAALPPLQGLPQRRLLCGPFDVATSAPRVVENFLDTAHFAFVHEGWLGTAQMPAVPDYDVVHDTAGRPAVLGYLAWQPRAQASASEGAWVRYDYRVLGPYSACLQKTPDAAGATAEAYVLWTCPLDEETTRVWFTIATEDAQIDDASLVAFQQQIFAQDRPVLESQRPRRLPVSAASTERHVASDRLSMAYRRWLVSEGINFGTC
jgi:phenylpropionate dioxygenase-like ring-hydroxylating dioxygenase large terminal subunit